MLLPDPEIPHKGLFDALALGGGIDPGELLEGFAVQFTYHGAGLPAAQLFEIFDPKTFDVLDSGFTVERPTESVPIPEPWMLLLFATGLGGLLLARLRRAAGNRS
jgi:hypothetical protein